MTRPHPAARVYSHEGAAAQLQELKGTLRLLLAVEDDPNARSVFAGILAQVHRREQLDRQMEQ